MNPELPYKLKNLCYTLRMTEFAIPYPGKKTVAIRQILFEENIV